jgi:hypothetical protein
MVQDMDQIMQQVLNKASVNNIWLIYMWSTCCVDGKTIKNRPL